MDLHFSSMALRRDSRPNRERHLPSRKTSPEYDVSPECSIESSPSLRNTRRVGYHEYDMQTTGGSSTYQCHGIGDDHLQDAYTYSMLDAAPPLELWSITHHGIIFLSSPLSCYLPVSTFLYLYDEDLLPVCSGEEISWISTSLASSHAHKCPGMHCLPPSEISDALIPGITAGYLLASTFAREYSVAFRVQGEADRHMGAGVFVGSVRAFPVRAIYTCTE